MTMNFDLVDVALTLAIICITIIFGCTTKKQTQSNIEANVVQMYFNAEMQLSGALRKFLSTNAEVIKKQKEYEISNLNIAYDCYLNSLEYICIKHEAKDITPKTFKEYFQKIIIETYENEFYRLRKEYDISKEEQIPENLKTENFLLWEHDFEYKGFDECENIIKAYKKIKNE